MLTDHQVEVLTVISNAAFVGLFLGTIGALGASAILVRRCGDRLAVILQKFIDHIGTGAAVAAVVSLALAVVRVVFFPLGEKGDVQLPFWFSALSMGAVPISAGMAVLYVRDTCVNQSSHARRNRTVLLRIVGGAILGSLASVEHGFDGYFVVRSNSGPLQYAALGALLGGFIGLVWALCGDRRDHIVK